MGRYGLATGKMNLFTYLVRNVPCKETVRRRTFLWSKKNGEERGPSRPFPGNSLTDLNQISNGEYSTA